MRAFIIFASLLLSACGDSRSSWCDGHFNGADACEKRAHDRAVEEDRKPEKN